MIYIRTKDQQLSTASKKVWRVFRYKGNWYQIGNEKVEVFRRKIFMQALGVAAGQLYYWEKDGKIPDAMFFKNVTATKYNPAGRQRYYSGVQIVNINNIVIEKWGWPHAKKPIEDEFCADITAAFYIKKELSLEEAKYFGVAKASTS